MFDKTYRTDKELRPKNSNPFEDIEELAERAAKATKSAIRESLNEEDATDEQRSREWFKSRLGMFTASKMPDLMKRLKNGEVSEAAKTVVTKVAIERTMTPEGIEMYIDEEMGKEFRQTRWGNKWEATARKKLSERLNIKIIDCGFGKNSEVAFFGGSADGITDDGNCVIEIKCPFDPVKHEKNRLIGTIDEKHEYYAQVQSHLLNYPDAICCVFASYDPRRAAPYNLAYYIVKRDDQYQKSIIEALMGAEEIIRRNEI